MLTGSYRKDNCLELWDLRKNEKIRTYDWNGPETGNTIKDDHGYDIKEHQIPLDILG